MRLLPSRSPLLALLAFAGEPVLAEANPITHTVQGSPSRITGSFSATIDIDVVTNWGTASAPSFDLSGTLTDTTAKPTGSVDVEWGSPAWDDSIEMDFAVTGSNVGSASGTRTVGFDIPLIGTVGVPVTIAFRIDSFSIASDESFVGATTPDDGGSAGSGPWTAADIQRLVFQPDLSLLITRPFGLGNSAVPFATIPPVEAPIPVAFELRREGGDPGTGSRALIDFGGISLGDYDDSLSVASPGCEVELSLIGCQFDVTSYRIRVSDVQLTNVGAHLEATQSGTPVPEPSTGLLLGMGLAGVAARAGRRRAALARAA